MWNSDGTKYATLSDKKIKVVDIDSGACKAEWTMTSRLNTMIFVNITRNGTTEECICAAGEDKLIHFYSYSPNENTLITSIDVSFKARVKDMDKITSKDKTYIAACSSDGLVHLIDLAQVSFDQPTSTVSSIASYEAGTRLTCMKLVPLDGFDYKTQQQDMDTNELKDVESDVESEVEERTIKRAKVVVEFPGKKNKKRKSKKSKTTTTTK
jgi:WD40 repeat protein